MENDQSKIDLGVGKPSEIEQLSNEVEQLQKRLSDKDAKIVTLQGNLAEKGQKETSLVDEIERLKSSLVVKDNKLLLLEEVNKENDKKIRSMNIKLQELQEQSKKFSEELQAKKEESERSKKRLADCVNQVEELNSRVEESKGIIDSSRSQIAEINRKLLHKDMQLSLLQTSARSLTSDMAEENTMLKREISILTDINEASNRRISFLEVQNELCRQDFEEQRQAKRRHERLNRVLLQKLRVERIEREDLQRLAEELLQETERAQAVIGDFQIMVENAQAGLQAVHPIIPDAQVDELLQEAGRAQALNGVARMMVPNALGGLEVVDPILPDEEVNK